MKNFIKIIIIFIFLFLFGISITYISIHNTFKKVEKVHFVETSSNLNLYKTI